MNRMYGTQMRSLCTLLSLSLFLVLLTPALGDDRVPNFRDDIGPLLKTKCAHCHGEEQAENGLRVDSFERVAMGGKTGGAITPGSLRDSLMWSFIATDKMPADDSKLTANERTLIRRWLLNGAPNSAKDVQQTYAPRETQGTWERRGVDAIAALIDAEIAEKLQRVDVTPAPSSDDAEFQQRLYLDLTGRIPTVGAAVVFLQDPADDKRQRLIDQLLASDEFGDHFATIWHKLLIPKSAGAYPRIPHSKFRNWLSDNFNKGLGWDEMVSQLLTAEGHLPSNKDNELARKKDAKLKPLNVATAFINVHNTDGRPQPKGIVSSVSKLFLAQSIECAQCHNHPQAKWEQTDFWAAAAFFERIRYQRAVYGDTSIGNLIEPVEGDDLVYEDNAKARYSFVRGVYQEPVIDLEDANGKPTGQFVAAKFLDGPEPQLERSQSYRRAFADWATAKENPFFARAMTNRVWGQLLGRGIVEPVDDMSEDNPPSHPRLLAALSREFAASGFDVKHLVRCICNSETYQRASSPPDKKERSPASLFALQALKQLTAEELMASLAIAVPTFADRLKEDEEDKNPGLFRKAFLEVHQTGISSATEHTRGLQQALRMMNGDGKFFNRDAVKNAVGDSVDIDANIQRIYLQALSRYPSDRELDLMRRYVEQAQQEIRAIDPKRLPKPRRDQPNSAPNAYADVLWTLVNSGEFIFNH